jgi:hypothetical protein
MGYYCVLIPIRERVLMHLDDAGVSDLFERDGRPDRRRTSLSMLLPYEHPWMDDLPVPPIGLEKMSRALHYLLTGSFQPVPSPLSRAIFGGAAIGPDVGDGRPRYLWSHEVRECSDALSALTPEEVHRRFNPAGMKAEYLWSGVNEDEDDEDLFDELSHDFTLLAAFYRIAAGRGDAVLIGVV